MKTAIAILLVTLVNSFAQPLVNVIQFTSTNHSASETGGVVTFSVEIAGGDYFAPNVYSVDYATVDGTARAGSDYLATSGTLWFLWPETNSQSFSISVLDDGVVEGDEAFSVVLSNPRTDLLDFPEAVLGNKTNAVITILDNDAAPTLTLDPWALRHSVPTNGELLNAVTYAASNFIAVGDAGVILTSLDGQDWILRNSGTTSSINGIAHGAGQFVAVGGGNNRGNIILTSRNGTDWAIQNSDSDVPLAKVAYGNGVFVSVGGSFSAGETNLILTSSDLTQWTIRESPTNSPITDVVFGNGIFVAVAGSAALTSSDGIAWVLHSDPGFGPMRWQSRSIYSFGLGNPARVIFADGRFIASGQGGLLISTNGRDWIHRGVVCPVDAALYPVAYAEGVYLALGVQFECPCPSDCNDCGCLFKGCFPVQKFILNSIDLVNWGLNAANTNRSSWADHFAYGNEQFVGVGNTSTILQSGNLAPVVASMGPRFVTEETRLRPEGPTQLLVQWWRADAPITLEASPDLRNWTPVARATNVTGTVEFTEPGIVSQVQRFYRALGR